MLLWPSCVENTNQGEMSYKKVYEKEQKTIMDTVYILHAMHWSKIFFAHGSV